MSKLIDDELKQLIQKAQDTVKQMLPFLQDEVHSIINSRETSEHGLNKSWTGSWIVFIRDSVKYLRKFTW
ncbi:MAG: hypothetical protein PVH61_01945 [Candidatus Aminicenantes bacterium]|jgi:hypothetical protein